MGSSLTGDWFDGAGLGMFIHWDHASQQGLEISWPMVGGISDFLPHGQSVSVEQYHSSAVTFEPANFDAVALARLAKSAGMTYAVFTAKHHSGYSMFFTRLSDFSVEYSPCRRDLVGEFVDAFRGEGLRIGIYYSLSDWHHPDYPAFTEEHKPYRPGATPPMPPPEVWERYIEYFHGQIRELLTGYGQIDLVWFDGWWERPADAWRADELAGLIRSLQPGIMINDRLAGQGDYTTYEQFAPPTAPQARFEVCMTMNESWGFNPSDDLYKTECSLVQTLCEVVAHGGNLLLNVSPRGDGSLPAEQIERLEALARWMTVNGESVHGTSRGLEPWQFYGPSTAKNDRIYLFLLYRPFDSITLRGVPVKRVTRVQLLATGEPLEFTTRTSLIDRIAPDPTGELTIGVPRDLDDEFATVVVLDVKPE